MKRKVAIVLMYFGNGGAENMVAHLVSHIDLSVVDVKVFCVYGNRQNNHLEQEVTDHGVEICYIGKQKGFSLKAIRNLWKELSIFMPDVVHTHLSACIYAAPWVLFHKVKMYHTIHSIPTFENRNKLRAVVSTILYKMKIAVPVAISDINRKMVADYYHISENQVKRVFNPVVTRRYYKNDNVSRACIRFVTVGRLSPEKNQAMMLEAMSQLIAKGLPVELQVIGAGAEEKKLYEYAQELRIAEYVEFVGHVDNVEDYLANADVFLLSSLIEGVPLSILEAMAAGLPIVATDVGGVKELVTDNGYLVSPQDLNEFVFAMEQLVVSEDLRRRMSKASQENIIDFDAKTIADEYTALYLE